MDSSAPQKRRVVLCMGEYCNLGRRADKLWRMLEPAIAELNGDARPPCLKLERANCLSLCALGPNLVIYPEDLVFSKLDEAQLREIIVRELRPCEES
ncbi:MAG: (2Fe-2S) ferredoxin domain-containing protein [Anaerolineae bacterium]|nr:(2Fe-2S) ferredoxin domain-containing protein [Anaerolineae bacterium]